MMGPHEKRENAVVFLGMSYPAGIMRYFAQFACALNRQFVAQEVDFYFASTSKENHVGAWDLVRKNFASARILEGDTYADVVEKVCCLLGSYKGVVFHFGGGWYQTKILLPYKRKYADRLKLVVTTHAFKINSWLRIPMSVLQGALYCRYVDKVIFQCPYAVRRFVLSRWLFRGSKGCILPLGVIPYDYVGSEPVQLRELGLSELLNRQDVFKIVYLARFAEGKNHEWLIRVLQRVMVENPKVHLLLCGGHDEVRYPAVRQLVKSIGIESQVHMPGVVPRLAIPYLLRHVDCAVVPSAAETFGHAYVEPMMAGVPVIGTRVGVGEYVLQDGFTGYGFDLGSPVQLQQALMYLIGHPAEARKIGLSGQGIARELFHMDRVAAAHVNLYKTLLA